MLISINDITLRAGDQLSFAHTTWQIEPGQHWAILGATGSGKSTLAKGISRQLALVGGQILYSLDGPGGAGRPYLYANEVLTFSVETQQAFTRQFVEYHQARWQSFEGEDAPLVGSLLDEQGDPEKKAGVIELLGIQTLLARKAHQLSHGESRKIFLARLLLRSPHLLILDDPYTGLDASSRERLKEGIDRLLEHAVPQILFLSSRVEDIPDGIDRWLLVHQHQVLAQGDRRSLQANPQYHGFFFATGTAPTKRAVSPALTSMVDRYRAALDEGEDLPEMIAMRGVSVTYQDVPILKGIDWTVLRGERWALLGPNGAGKTTLLSLILGDHPQAYTNDLRLFGRQRGSGESIWQIKRRIGWVSPELHAFYDRSRTTREVISSGFFDSVGLYRRCTPEQADIVSGWMEALNLASLADGPFSALSTGQQRLALLARALVKNPPLLVLDEPCQGLDSAHRAQFTGLIDSLCRAAPVTLIYVSHYPDELPAVITRRLYLCEGKVQHNPPAERGSGTEAV